MYFSYVFLTCRCCTTLEKSVEQQEKGQNEQQKQTISLALIGNVAMCAAECVCVCGEHIVQLLNVLMKCLMHFWMSIDLKTNSMQEDKEIRLVFAL